ncbi:MAG: restriction endonuclease subunit S, partial [Bacillota bacterium]
MNKNKKTALAPRLQFPEFRDNGEWKEERLDKFFSIGSSKRVLQEQWTYKGVPFYRTRELVSLSKGEPFGSEIFISEELYNVLSETYGVPSEGDFLVSGVGTLGVSYQVKAEDKFYFKDGNVLWFKLNEGLYSTYFKYSFQSDYIQKQIYGQTSKSTVGTYTIQNAKKTKLWCPPTISEQKKIANCFSSLDDLITAEDKKLEAFKAHKKGLMQKLFPVEGKTLPEWRFPEFKDGGNWEETSFKQVFSKLQYGLNAAAKEYDGKNKYIRITDIDESSRRYLSEKAVSPDCELDDVYLVREGDILFARTGASTGKTYIYTTDDGILYFAGFLIRGNVNE